MAIRIVDVTDDATFRLLPAVRGSGLRPPVVRLLGGRRSGLEGRAPVVAPRRSRAAAGQPPSRPRNPFGDDEDDEPAVNPFAPGRKASFNPFATDDEPAFNPFAPAPEGAARPSPSDAPPKLRLLGRGLAVFGSYAKVLLDDDEAAAYAQFGPLSAYPRALRTRELYPRLPDVAAAGGRSPASRRPRAARDRGLAAMLVEAVCDDLAGRGFAAVETYPEVGARADATSAATPAFWERLGFVVAARG